MKKGSGVEVSNNLAKSSTPSASLKNFLRKKNYVVEHPIMEKGKNIASLPISCEGVPLENNFEKPPPWVDQLEVYEPSLDRKNETTNRDQSKNSDKMDSPENLG